MRGGYDDDDWTDGKRLDGKDIFFTVNGERKNAWETCIWYCEQLKSEDYELESDYTSIKYDSKKRMTRVYFCRKVCHIAFDNYINRVLISDFTQM